MADGSTTSHLIYGLACKSENTVGHNLINFIMRHVASLEMKLEARNLTNKYITLHPYKYQVDNERRKFMWFSSIAPYTLPLFYTDAWSHRLAGILCPEDRIRLYIQTKSKLNFLPNMRLILSRYWS